LIEAKKRITDVATTDQDAVVAQQIRRLAWRIAFSRPVEERWRGHALGFPAALSPERSSTPVRTRVARTVSNGTIRLAIDTPCETGCNASAPESGQLTDDAHLDRMQGLKRSGWNPKRLDRQRIQGLRFTTWRHRPAS
jgi:hypothetical protein